MKGSKGRMEPLWLVLRSIIVIYLAIVALVFLMQHKMIFFPQKAASDTLDQMAHQLGLLSWQQADGTGIGWIAPGNADGEGQPYLLVHGNAGFALHRYEIARSIQAHDPNATVYLFEYPGYGARDGKPGVRTITIALERAIDDMRRRSDVPVILIGESLGTGFVAKMMTRKTDRIAGALFVTPFNRLSAVASSHYPWLPVRLLLRVRLDAESGVRSFNRPVAVVVAERDVVVPPQFGRALYQACNEPRKLWILKGCGHNTVPYHHRWLGEAIDFLKNTEQ